MNKRYLLNALAGGTAVVLAGGLLARASDPRPAGNLLTSPAVTRMVYLDSAAGEVFSTERDNGSVSSSTLTAVAALGGIVRGLSHPQALETAFRSYFAFKAKNPDQVRKPLLYFVDYGLSATTPRGYLFDMQTLKIVDGPFTVAHGRGSSSSRAGKPTRFSNEHGSAATSLGLYVAQELYKFSGTAGGRKYASIGLRLAGVSGSFNDNARARGVVAHGAPYVTKNSAGRSEGCPAVDPQRAQTLLPRLAQGGLVFLFAPVDEWMDRDPWIAEGRG